MNIHEHQAKEILKEYGAPVSNGIVVFSFDEFKNKISKLKSKKFVLKAQIHAGGRGKAGGVKLVNSLGELEIEMKKMMGNMPNLNNNPFNRFGNAGLPGLGGKPSGKKK